MMDQLQTIKSNIVSLINRDGRNSISLEILLRDYEKCMGCTLPFRELRSADALGLLTQMQDVLAIKEEMGETMVQVHSKTSKPKSNFLDQLFHPSIDANMTAKFRQILEAYPEGITAPEFYKEYISRFKECFIPQKFGFVTLESALISLTEICKVDRTTSSELTIFDSRINPQTKKTNRELWIPTQVIDNLALISQEYPDGLDGHQIINIYKKRFGCCLNLKLLGFENIEHFLMKCPSIKVLINGDQCTVFPKKWGNLNQLIKKADPLPILGDDIKVIWSTYFGDDVCGPDAQFKKMNLINLNLMSIIMSHAHAPNKFWIHIISKIEDMNYMMSSLRKFYDENETKFIIGELLIKENLVCATKWSSDWYRALITKKIDKEIAEVFFIDYGTVSSVPLKDIRALHKQFLDDPIYAICSSLHGIAPPELIEEYTAESCDFFSTKYFRKLLHVTWYQIKLTDPVLQLVLIDPAQEEEESINYTLIKAGHATIHPLMRSIQINPVIENEVDYIVNFYEVLPSWQYLSGNGYQDLGTADHVLDMCNCAEENKEFVPTDTCCKMHFIRSMFMKNPRYVIHAWKDLLSSYESQFEDKAIRCAMKSNDVELNAKSLECMCHRDDYLPQLPQVEIGESSTQVLQIPQQNEIRTQPEEQKEH